MPGFGRALFFLKGIAVDQNSKPLACPVCKTGHVRHIETHDRPVVLIPDDRVVCIDDDFKGEQESNIYRCNNCLFIWDDEAELLHALTA